MREHLSLKFLTAVILLAVLAAMPAYAQNGRGRGLEIAIAAQERHTNILLSSPGVIGTGVGLGPGGQPVVVVYLEMPAAAANVPDMLDSVPVKKVVTGRFNAYAPPPLNAEFTWSCNGLTCDFDASSTTGKGKKSYSWDFVGTLRQFFDLLKAFKYLINRRIVSKSLRRSRSPNTS